MQTAARFVALFDDYVWRDFEHRGYPTPDVECFIVTIERLRTLGREVVGGTLDHAVDTAAREALPRCAERIARHLARGTLGLLLPVPVWTYWCSCSRRRV